MAAADHPTTCPADHSKRPDPGPAAHERKRIVTRRSLRKSSAWTLAAALVVAGALGLPGPAAADPPVIPGNEGDVGVYTNGQNHVMEIGDPVYTQRGRCRRPSCEPGVPYTADSMHQSIFEQDLAAGGTDYYLDRVLGVRGAVGSACCRPAAARSTCAARATTTSPPWASPAAPSSAARTTSATSTPSPCPDRRSAEVNANRFNAPSHAKSRYTIGTTGVTADLTKFITYDNVAVTAIKLHQPGRRRRHVHRARGVAAGHHRRRTAADELTGTRTMTSGANNGLIDTPWVRMHGRPQGGRLHPHRRQPRP